jgi:phage tail-like protein
MPVPLTKAFVPVAWYRVQVQDAVVGLFTECTGLTVEYEVLPYAAGGDDFVHQLRGRKKYQNLVLKRGMTNDKALATWFNETKKRDSRGAVTISLLTQATKDVRKWTFSHAHPIKWEGPTLSARGGIVATEVLEIAHEGFQEL